MADKEGEPLAEASAVPTPDTGGEDCTGNANDDNRIANKMMATARRK